MNLKDRQPVLFLALLIPAIAGQLAAAEDKPGGDYALVIDVYSGAVAPAVIQEKEFWSGLESLKDGREPNGAFKNIGRLSDKLAEVFINRQTTADLYPLLELILA